MTSLQHRALRLRFCSIHRFDLDDISYLEQHVEAFMVLTNEEEHL